MKYQITIRNGNGETIRTETTAAAFAWTDGKAQNNVYATAAALVADTPTAAAFRVLPCDDTLLALHVATAAARAAANRGGKATETEHTDMPTPTDTAAAGKAARKAGRQSVNAKHNATQETIYTDLRRITAGTAAALATAGKAATTDTAAAYIFAVMPTANAHTQDFFSVCLLATLDTDGTPTDKAAAAFRAANAYTRQSQTAHAREVSTEYIVDGGGDLVVFGTAAAYILHGGEKWTPTDGGTMDTDTAAALGATLAAAFALLTPVQRDIVRHVVNGYSVRQTAAKMRRNPSTIQRNLDGVRRVFGGYIAENAPQFLPIIATATAAAAANREKGNAAAAERMRRYRERKAAARAAATANA